VKLSPSFTLWLQKLIEPAPEQRFASASQALNALKSGLVVQPKTPKVVNNSGCGINNLTETVPEEIQGWNWGAFLLPWLWLWTNSVWYGLFCFVPQIGWIMAIALGAKGNEWAWKSRKWRSIEQFKKHQRGWAIAGVLLGAPISIMLWIGAFMLLASVL
jgi:hypothetical protein